MFIYKITNNKYCWTYTKVLIMLFYTPNILNMDIYTRIHNEAIYVL